MRTGLSTDRPRHHTLGSSKTENIEGSRSSDSNRCLKTFYLSHCAEPKKETVQAYQGCKSSKIFGLKNFLCGGYCKRTQPALRQPPNLMPYSYAASSAPLQVPVAGGYTLPCEGIDCTLKKTPGFDSGIYAYQTNLAASLNPNAGCCGDASGPGMLCSFYGADRRPISAGPNTLNNTVMYHRSALSAACAPATVVRFEETWDRPANLTPEQAAVLNKGAILSPLHTRSFENNSLLIESQGGYQYHQRADNRRGDESWKGFRAVPGMLTSTRDQAACAQQARFLATANEGPSAKSYGNYGVSVIRG